jgi:hypothetical protein
VLELHFSKNQPPKIITYYIFNYIHLLKYYTLHPVMKFKYDAGYRLIWILDYENYTFPKPSPLLGRKEYRHAGRRLPLDKWEFRKD